LRVLKKTLENCKSKDLRFQFIIHNAGITKAARKEDYFRVNFINTQNFIQAMIQTDMIPEKFIYMSSLAAYGPGEPETLNPVSFPILLILLSSMARVNWNLRNTYNRLQTFPLGYLPANRSLWSP